LNESLEKTSLLNTEYFHSLDGIRGLAVLFVSVFHFGRMKTSSLKFEIGWVGLQIFFVLSGFLITKILLATKGNSLSSFFRQFYLRRALRIFPLYYGYLLLILMLSFAFNEQKDLKYAYFLFTYSYNFSIFQEGWELSRMHVHLWSLSVEEQFYLIWPFAIYFLSVKSLKKLMLCLILIIPLLRFALEVYLTNTFASKDQELIGNMVYWFSLSNFDAFAIGGAINFLGNDLLGFNKKRWLILTMAICIVVAILNGSKLSSIGIYDISSFGFPLHSTLNEQHLWSYTLLNFFFAALIWNTLTAKRTPFNFKPLQGIGKISYGMYVFHFLILIVFDKLRIFIYNDLVTLIIYLFTCIAVSYLSYYGIEKRILSFKNKI
jgi:peptidoglycan/LPS O-acetylase OafA/YrhL